MTKGHDKGHKGHKGQMSDREVMKLALEALDEGLTMKEWRELVAALRDRLAQPEMQPQTPDDLLRQSEREGWRYAKECEAEVKRLRQALEQPEQEPVAWMYEYTRPDGSKYVSPVLHDRYQRREVGVYTAPPKREWVGLTDEEIEYIWGIAKPDYEDMFDFPRAIEAKLREKNGF